MVTDIDSYYLCCYGPDPLPLQECKTWNIYLRPQHNYTIRHNTKVSASPPNLTAAELSTYPNMMFADYGDCNINICFPRLKNYYRQNRSNSRDPNVAISSDSPGTTFSNLGLKNTNIEQMHHRIFVNNVLVPSIKHVCGDAIQAHPISLNYDNAARAGVGKSDGKFTSSQINAIISHMATILDDFSSAGHQEQERSDGYFLFEDFFFVIYTHGMKYVMPPTASIEETICEALNNQNLDTGSITIENLTVDIGFTFLPSTPTTSTGLTGLWSDFSYVRRLFFKPNIQNKFRGSYRQDDFCHFEGLGGFKHSGDSHEPYNIKSVQFYGDWKHAFFNRNLKSNRQGKDIKPTDIFDSRVSHGKVYSNWFENLITDSGCMANDAPTYGARAEFRINSQNAGRLYAKTSEPQMK
ncbi:hypothetical protein BD408DRAFT_438133 [Parasitella parasitica]|nr:hypothetical protein BD408DRAFT_438133 [Parasitella parasitica]